MNKITLGMFGVLFGGIIGFIIAIGISFAVGYLCNISIFSARFTTVYITTYCTVIPICSLLLSILNISKGRKPYVKKLVAVEGIVAGIGILSLFINQYFF